MVVMMRSTIGGTWPSTSEWYLAECQREEFH
jgi:hypothetical protein